MAKYKIEYLTQPGIEGDREPFGAKAEWSGKSVYCWGISFQHARVKLIEHLRSLGEPVAPESIPKPEEIEI